MSAANLVPESNLPFNPPSAQLARGTIWAAAMLQRNASETAWHGRIVTFLSKAMIVAETFLSIPLILIETTASLALAGIAATINKLSLEYWTGFLQRCTSMNLSFSLNSIGVLTSMVIRSYMSIKTAAANEEAITPLQISNLPPAEIGYQNYLTTLSISAGMLLVSQRRVHMLGRDGISGTHLIRTQDRRIHQPFAALISMLEMSEENLRCPRQFSIELNECNGRHEKLTELCRLSLALNENQREAAIEHILRNNEPAEGPTRNFVLLARELGNDLLQSGVMTTSYFHLDTLAEKNQPFERVNLLEIGLREVVKML